MSVNEEPKTHPKDNESKKRASRRSLNPSKTEKNEEEQTDKGRTAVSEAFQLGNEEVVNVDKADPISSMEKHRDDKSAKKSNGENSSIKNVSEIKDNNRSKSKAKKSESKKTHLSYESKVVEEGEKWVENQEVVKEIEMVGVQGKEESAKKKSVSVETKLKSRSKSKNPASSKKKTDENEKGAENSKSKAKSKSGSATPGKSLGKTVTTQDATKSKSKKATIQKSSVKKSKITESEMTNQEIPPTDLKSRKKSNVKQTAKSSVKSGKEVSNQ